MYEINIQLIPLLFSAAFGVIFIQLAYSVAALLL